MVGRRAPPSSRAVMADRGTGDGLSPETAAAAASGGLGLDWPTQAGDADDDDDDDETTDYRRRCLLLEASLIKFKEKATRVRQLFTVKVGSNCVRSYKQCISLVSVKLHLRHTKKQTN